MRFFCRLDIKQRFNMRIGFWLFGNNRRFPYFLRLISFNYKTIAISGINSTFAYRIKTNESITILKL